MAIQKIIAKTGQSIYDVNLMYYSGFDSIVKFCKDNGIENLNQLDVSGKELSFDTNLNNALSSTSIVNNKGLVFTTLLDVGGVRITDEGNDRITDEGYIRIIE